jgi:Tol biopolymer transport system component
MRRSVVMVLGGWALLGMVSCTDQEPTHPAIRAAVGGGSGSPSVTATNPDSATQDTTLDVIVSGSGFDQGSQAQWAIAGVPSTKVHTNSTQFVTSRKLIANITIAVDADTGLYDVIVTASTGKKGIGSELFAIKAHKNASADPAIAFSGLAVVDADGSNQTTLLSGGLPSWAPNGDGTASSPYSLVFEASPCRMSRVDVVVNGATVQATDLAAFPTPSLATSACHPSWSPAGNEIAFGEGSVNCPNNDCPRPSSLWIMPADPARASEAVAIYDAPFNVAVYWPTWSPGADYLAFVELNVDEFSIRVIDRSSGASWLIVDQTQFSFIRSLDWARRKNAIAFSAVPKKGGVQNVYIIDLDATAHAAAAARQVLRGASDPSWSPDDSRLVVVSGGLKILDLTTGRTSIGLGNGTFPDWRR